MIILQKNNVHVSGRLLDEKISTPKTVQLVIGITQASGILPIHAVVNKDMWENFKSSFPYSSITVSGRLKAYRNGNGLHYEIQVGNSNSITCFHNILNDESEIKFVGPVVLQRKFDFNTESNLYLKRMIFRTCDEYPTYFEAIALRGIAPYFDNIKEGERLLLKANYVQDSNGNPPYWRIKHRPQAN